MRTCGFWLAWSLAGRLYRPGNGGVDELNHKLAKVALGAEKIANKIFRVYITVKLCLKIAYLVAIDDTKSISTLAPQLNSVLVFGSETDGSIGSNFSHR
jgi:hypothetical protein